MSSDTLLLGIKINSNKKLLFAHPKGGKEMNEQDYNEQKTEQNDHSRKNEELHDVLIAISVVAKRLASRMEATEEES